MAKEGDYTIKNIYQGGYSSLDPNKAYSNYFTGYRANPGSLGITTDPRTANVIKEASAKLSSGLKQIELEFISPEIFDSVPKQQLKEINELSRLTGVDVSVHGPVIDTAGMSQQGFSELNREAAERRISEFLERIRDVNPNGIIPVTFHSAEGIPGSEWKTLGEPGKEREAKRLIAVNRETGQMTQLETERIFHPAMKELKPEIENKMERGIISSEQFHEMKPEEKYNFIPLKEGKLQKAETRLQSINATTWDDSITQLLFNKERADEILQQNQTQIQHLMEDLEKGRINPKLFNSTQKQAYDHWMNARYYLDDTRQHIETLFNKAYKYGDEENKKLLTNASKQFGKQLEEDKTPMGQSKAIQDLLYNLKRTPPEMFIPIEKFATEQSSKTFGNAAFNMYSKSKDINKTPIVVIENPPAGFGLSTGEDLRNIVVASRKHFVERAVKEKAMNEKEAEKIAEKLIGATWDVGHINMLRKQGFTEKDIIKETEKIAPYVKHVHLSDNFGFEHTELPMGMGNVPIKEIMEKLGKKGFEAKKIIEASSWWQHMQTSPMKESLEGMGSPMYSFGGGPYWNQSLGLQQGYSSGFGMMLPSNNYQTFGAGFSQLPTELGGEVMRGTGGKFSQKGME